MYLYLRKLKIKIIKKMSESDWVWITIPGIGILAFIYYIIFVHIKDNFIIFGGEVPKYLIKTSLGYRI